ncbi:ankyrin repeat domain-containing protein [uncultured Arcticibacterium sp.]|uniref:ankyrin repeat domain-containing protein n=1 Tax=uncultured Arcticibacterium sp. TaxID=2173042 RepID=UPI0030FAF490
MLVLLLKASFILAILLVFYTLFLEKESFFSTNRVYLLASLALAFTLPYIVLPKMVNKQGLVSEFIEKVDSKPAISTSISGVEVSQKVEDFSKIESSAQSASNERTLVDWLVLVYYFGVAIFFLNFVSQLISILLKVWKSHDKIKDEHAVIVNSAKVQEPYSFLNYIFINPESYDFETYEQILKHEKIHVSKRHSFDLLFAELAVIILWFNPLVWLWRKEVEKNIEYQTDDLLLERKAVKRDSYQMNLLKVATYTGPLSITTNYNQSLLKQRIMKMNTKKSNNQSYWKYAFMLPLLFGTLLLINKPLSVFAQTSIKPLSDITESLKPSQSSIDDIQKTANPDSNKNEEWGSDEAVFGNETDGEWSGGDEVFGSKDDTFENESSSESIRDFLFSTEGCRNLLRAVKNENPAKVKDFLKSQNPDCTYTGDGEPRSPLVAAARNGNYEIGKMILEAGGDTEYHFSRDESPLMAVSRSGNLELAHLLLEYGAEVDKESRGDGTALIYAVRNNRYEIAELLLEAGADPYQNVPGDEYAMFHARNSGNKKMIKLLKEYE